MKYLPLLLLCVACDVPPSEADAGDAGTTVTNTFCFGRPKLEFCEDFDGAPLPGAFATAHNLGGQARLDDSAFTTMPRSVVMQTTEENAVVTLSAPGTDARQTFKTFVQLRVDEKPTTGAAEVLSIGNGAHHYSLWLDANEALSVVADGQALGETTLSSGNWNSVRLDVLHDGGTRYINFTVGSTPVVSREPIPDAGALPSATFTLGLADAGAGWQARFDTVTFIYE